MTIDKSRMSPPLILCLEKKLWTFSIVNVYQYMTQPRFNPDFG